MTTINRRRLLQGTVSIDDVAYPASGRMIPNYQIYGYGDLAFLEGTPWDDIQNSLDDWAQYHLQVNDLTPADADTAAGRRSGFRSHNTTAEESPLLWDFLKHYSHEVGAVTRYCSPSAFHRPGDRKRW